MNSSNKESSTKEASSFGGSAPLLKNPAFLLNAANSKAYMIIHTRQDDRAMNDAYSASIESHN